MSSFSCMDIILTIKILPNVIWSAVTEIMKFGLSFQHCKNANIYVVCICIEKYDTMVARFYHWLYLYITITSMYSWYSLYVVAPSWWLTSYFMVNMWQDFVTTFLCSTGMKQTLFFCHWYTEITQWLNCKTGNKAV